MKKILLSLLLLNSLHCANAQDTLFTENFEFAPTAFTLNTTDVSSTSSGYNNWVVNNSYTGGNGTLTCIGSQFTFTIPATDAQPAGIFLSPSSHYLHMVSDSAIANGVTNCNFSAADGICNTAERYFSSMSTDVSFTFWWLCDGGNNSYGEVYYSIDAGLTWTIIPPLKYNNQPTWAQKSISDPAFAHQNTLRFGFRFVNKVALSTSDPGFGIDDIMITASVFTGIEDMTTAENSFSVSPNPFTGELILKGNAVKAGNYISVTDAYGKEVFSDEIFSAQQHVNTSLLSKGVYFISVNDGSKKYIRKIVKM